MADLPMSDEPDADRASGPLDAQDDATSAAAGPPARHDSAPDDATPDDATPDDADFAAVPDVAPPEAGPSSDTGSDDAGPDAGASIDAAQDSADPDVADPDVADNSGAPTSADTAVAVSTAGTAPLLPPDPADAARRRLVRALRPRLTRSQLLAAVICAVLGFSIVVQARQSQVQSLASMRQSDLITVLDNVTQESARLDAQAAALQQTLAGMRSSSDRSPAALQAAQDRLNALGVLAGTVPATGPGVQLDITDPKVAVNATDMLETVQELRDAGAEAMQLGTVRVVASTSFVDDPNGLIVDGTVLSPPYRLLVIGDPQTLGAALEIPGGVLEVLRNKGSTGTVRQLPSLGITALRMLRTPQYARPAQPAAP